MPYWAHNDSPACAKILLALDLLAFSSDLFLLVPLSLSWLCQQLLTWSVFFSLHSYEAALQVSLSLLSFSSKCWKFKRKQSSRVLLEFTHTDVIPDISQVYRFSFSAEHMILIGCRHFTLFLMC